jgi:hypothetical protein
MATTTRTRTLLGASLIGLAAAASAQDVTVTTPQAYVAVEPGQHVTVPLVFVNHGAAASPAVHLILTDDANDYAFEQASEPDCGPIVPSTTFAGWTEFEVAPIAAGATRTCSIRVDRGAGEVNNADIDWFISESPSWVYFGLGTFVDIAITGSKVASSVDDDGTIRATFRLNAHNAGAVATDGVVVGLGPTCVGSAIAVDTDFEGGCAADNVACGFTGGPAPAARLPVIAPNASESCLVRFTVPAGTDPEVHAYLAAESLRNAANGGYIDDTDPANNQPLLVLSPTGSLSAIALPSMSAWSLTALALALAAVASGFRRRSRR